VNSSDDNIDKADKLSIKTDENKNDIAEWLIDESTGNDPYNSTESNYTELKAEFDRYLGLAKQRVSDQGMGWDAISSLAQSRTAFEELLNHRQSLYDFRESMDYIYGNDSFGKVSIEVEATFTSGGINYRVLTYAADSLAATRMYIQFYDDETINSKCVYVYYNDADEVGKILYCGFQHDSYKSYLIIISKGYSLGASYRYYVINYEIDGNNIRNYGALRKEVSDDIWIVRGVSVSDETIPFDAVLTRLTHSYLPDTVEIYNLDIDSKLTFESNKLVIVLNNDSEDGITLLFENGFWEIVEKEE